MPQSGYKRHTYAANMIWRAGLDRYHPICGGIERLYNSKNCRVAISRMAAEGITPPRSGGKISRNCPLELRAGAHGAFGGRIAESAAPQRQEKPKSVYGRYIRSPNTFRVAIADIYPPPRGGRKSRRYLAH